MILTRDLTAIAANTYLAEALEIIKKWSEDAKAKGIKNKELETLLNAQIGINVYIASLQMERVGFDQSIDSANKIAKQTAMVNERLSRENRELREKIKLYEL